MFEETDNFKSQFNLRDQIEKYLGHWKWFLLSIIIIVLLVYLKLNFVRPQYIASSAVLIKNENANNDSKLSVFQDLGIMSNSRNQIEDEIEMLKSKNLMYEIIESLKLNIQFFTDKNKISDFFDENLSTKTNFFENERYLNPPLIINFFSSDSIINESFSEFTISVISSTSYRYTDEEKTFKSTFGEKFKIKNIGEIIITPNFSSNDNIIGKDIFVRILPISSLASSYSSRISIEPRSDFSNIVDISITDSHRKKAENFLKKLIDKYNERSVNQKEQLTKSTSDFVTNRLEQIEIELSDIDLSAESFKTRNRISDAVSEAGINLQSNQEIERQIVEANTELQKIEFVKDYVSSSESNELFQFNFDIADSDISNLTRQYNDLMLEKQRMLKTSTDKNPVVVNIDDQLKDLKESISKGLMNLQSSQRISIDALEKQDRRINSRLYSAPRQERQLRTIQRQQQIKEALFLYLLEKREEIAITLGVAEPNLEVIDKPIGYSSPVSPNKKVYYLASIFIALLLPFSILYVKDFLDTKIKTREEVEKLLNIPILGDIPKLESKNFLISDNDHSSMAEAFRILRTNLSFILTDSSEMGKTIFITSTIAHEGKSLVSSNLAASLALAGKKTLLIGMDIRAPRIKEYLTIRGKIGVTNYIVDPQLTLKDITNLVPNIEKLHLISSGDIAPNPAELLMNPRVKQLFKEIKNNYEYIIVDTAASSIVTDTMLLREYADAFIYVIRVNYLDKRQLNFVRSVYKEKRLQNLALLVNGVDPKKSYGYGYGYGFEHQKSKAKWWRFK